MYKFQVGDKIKFIGGKHLYNFGGKFTTSAKIGDTFEVSSVGKAKYQEGYVYSVKGGIKEDNPCKKV